MSEELLNKETNTMRFIKNRKVLAAVAVATAVALAGGVAQAYWTSTGSGTGSGSTASAVGTVTLTQTSTVTGLAPGTPAQALTGTVTVAGGTNASAYIATVTPSFGAGQTWQSGCTAADYTFTNGTVNADKVTGSTDVPFGTIAFNNKPSTDQSGCKGQALVLAFTSN